MQRLSTIAIVSILLTNTTALAQELDHQDNTKSSLENTYKQIHESISKADLPEEVAALNKAINLNPNNSDLYKIRGQVHYWLKEYNNAIADYNESIRLNDKDLETVGARAGAYAKLGESQKAIDDCSILINADSKNAAAYMVRGGLYAKLGQHQQAVDDLSSCINLDPKFAISYGVRGESYAKLGQLERALDDYNQAIDLASQRPSLEQGELYYQRADVYQQLGKLDLMKKDRVKAKELGYMSN